MVELADWGQWMRLDGYDWFLVSLKISCVSLRAVVGTSLSIFWGLTIDTCNSTGLVGGLDVRISISEPSD